MEDFAALTNQAVLEIYGPMLKTKSGLQYSCHSNDKKNEYVRAVCYRVITQWLYGKIGWRNRHPLPACIYHYVRTKYFSTEATFYTNE